jgi:hypothetical protein
MEAVQIDHNKYNHMLAEFNRSANPRLGLKLEDMAETEKEESLIRNIRELRKQRNRERGSKRQQNEPKRKRRKMNEENEEEKIWPNTPPNHPDSRKILQAREKKQKILSKMAQNLNKETKTRLPYHPKKMERNKQKKLQIYKTKCHPREHKKNSIPHQDHQINIKHISPFSQGLLLETTRA